MNTERMQQILEGQEFVLSNWQRGFLESVLQQATKGHALSPRQKEILFQIEEENNAKAIAQRSEWVSLFRSDEEKKESFRIAIEYYKSSGYFASIIHKYTPEYVPTEKEYNKICNNKYARKVLEAHFSKAKFSTGDIVQFRSNNRINTNLRAENGRYVNLKANSYAAVLEINALPIKRAALGAKVYKVLPFGDSRTLYVSESDIKKARGIKT